MDADIGQLIFFPEEDAEEILLRYIDLMAQWQTQYSTYEICKVVFQHLRDPGLRSAQAADVWSKDLEIKEAIRQKVLYKDGPPKDEKTQYKDVLKSIYEDQLVSARDRVAALRLVAELDGHVIKAVDKKVTKNQATSNTFIFKEYEDE